MRGNASPSSPALGEGDDTQPGPAAPAPRTGAPGCTVHQASNTISLSYLQFLQYTWLISFSPLYTFACASLKCYHVNRNNHSIWILGTLKFICLLTDLYLSTQNPPNQTSRAATCFFTVDMVTLARWKQHRVFKMLVNMMWCPFSAEHHFHGTHTHQPELRQVQPIHKRAQQGPTTHSWAQQSHLLL